MKKFDQWFFPDGETHLIDWMAAHQLNINGRLGYQYSKYKACKRLLKNNRLAIDVGAHIGLWSWFMARDFKDVACFEPVEAHRECWHANMKEWNNAEMFETALGSKAGKVAMMTDVFSTGNTRVDPDATVKTIDVQTLDHYNFENVDFLKVDCEGYEMEVLRGAKKTLLRCKPVICVEQKGDMGERYGEKQQSAVQYLQDLGAVMKHAMSGDYIFTW